MYILYIKITFGIQNLILVLFYSRKCRENCMKSIPIHNRSAFRQLSRRWLTKIDFRSDRGLIVG